MSLVEALRQCIEAMKLVDFKDCGESESLWKQLNDAQANAERVLREGEKQEPAVNSVDALTKYSGASIANTYWMEQEDFYLADEVKTALATHPAPSLQAVVEVPEGWKLVPIKLTPEMVEAGANCDPERESPWAAYLAAAPQPPAAPSGDAMPVSVRALTDNLLIAVDNLGHAEGGLEGLDQLHSAARHLRRGLGE